MLKHIFKTIILVCFLLLPAAVCFSQLNTNVGISQVSVFYIPTKSEIKGIVWYPTLEKTKIVKLGPYELNVARQPTIKEGKHGLIVISHGSRGSHLGHRDTALYLAARDYIVVSILHPRNNYSDDSAGRTLENWRNRPRHISEMLDALLGDSQFKKYIDRKRIAVIGHSAGGYTALAVAGGIPDSANIRTHCEKHGDDPEFCGIYRHGLGLKIASFINNPGAEKKTLIENTHDHRIRAAVLMAPVGILFKGKESLSKVMIPVRIYRAEKDTVLRFPYHAESIRQNLPMDPEYRVVKNAGHYSFISPFPENAKKTVGKVARDPDGFNREEFHSKMNQEIYEFISRSLNTGR